MEAQEQLKIIMKGASQVIDADELLARLQRSIATGQPLQVKLGLDPSAPDIHIGHAVVLRKARQLQDLGHRVVIVIGDFTGRIGDPTGKSKTRRQLTGAEVLANAATYERQIFRVLDRSRTTVRFNSEWLAGLDFAAVLRLAAQTTVARILERDDFAGRFARQEPIGLHEFFYPLMQAYDSVELRADIELGGTDQTFNILMGRTLQKSCGQESQIALFIPLLEGTDGVEKMSKSLGNTIGIQEDAATIYRKVMSIPDRLIIRYYELATDVHPDRISRIQAELADPRTNPRDVKMGLARTITALYHGDDAALAAEGEFRTIFQLGGCPEGLAPAERSAEFRLPDGSIDLVRLLTCQGIVRSSSDARRLIAQGGLKVNGERWEALTCPDSPAGLVIQAGKGRFVRLAGNVTFRSENR